MINLKYIYFHAKDFASPIRSVSHSTYNGRDSNVRGFCARFEACGHVNHLSLCFLQLCRTTPGIGDVVPTVTRGLELKIK